MHRVQCTQWWRQTMSWLLFFRANCLSYSLSAPIRWRPASAKRKTDCPFTSVQTVILLHSIWRCLHDAHSSANIACCCNCSFLKESGLYKHFDVKASSSSLKVLNDVCLLIRPKEDDARCLCQCLRLSAECWHPITMKQWASCSHCCNCNSSSSIIRCMSVYFYSALRLGRRLQSSSCGRQTHHWPQSLPRKEGERKRGMQWGKEKLRVHRRQATERVVCHWIDESNYHYLSHYYDCY